MLNDLMGAFHQAHEQMEEAKKKLDQMFVNEEIEGGLIKITANGNKQVTNIEISESILNDREALEDLILTAVNKIYKKADQLYEAEMQNVAKGMLPNIPGLF